MSARTLAGNSSGMPCACTAIRLILRWSWGLPKRFEHARLRHADSGRERARSKRTRSPFLASPSSPAGDRPFLELLAVDGIDDAAAFGHAAGRCRVAAAFPRQPLDGLGLVAIAGDVGLSRRVSRARMRSPCPSAGAAAPRARAGSNTSARGLSPSARSQTAGSAISSPSASRATIRAPPRGAAGRAP